MVNLRSGTELLYLNPDVLSSVNLVVSTDPGAFMQPSALGLGYDTKNDGSPGSMVIWSSVNGQSYPK